MHKNYFMVLAGVFFVVLFASCVSGGNNGVGTGDVGNTHIEAAASAGAISGGLEGVERSAEEITGSLEASAEQQQSAITGNSGAQSGISEAIDVNIKIGELLRSISDREDAKRSGITNENQHTE